MHQFDYVVIGAGSAGCVVAARLAEAGKHVCVLEAGPVDRNIMLHIPAGFIRAVSNPKLTWQFLSAPVPGAGGRSIPLIQGKVLGGSSSINGLVYNRCQHADYDSWAQAGNSGWGYADILPYFQKSETRIGVGDDAYRGRKGPITVSNPRDSGPLYQAFIEAAKAQGIKFTDDYNGAEQDGVGDFQFTIDTRSGPARRMSTAVAYLHPAQKTQKLTVITNALVEKILFEGKRAVGVRYQLSDGDEAKTITARHEVILSAGAINTPKLLQISGVGAGAHLQSIGQEVIIESPGVGYNLSDHYQIRLSARLSRVKTFNERARGLSLVKEIINWSLGRASVLGVGPVPMRLFHRTNPALTYPDLQMSFTPGSYKLGETGRLDSYPGMTIGGYQQRPESRGYVCAVSTDPKSQPEIQPNYLAASTDCNAIIEVIRMARRLMREDAFAPYFIEETFPGHDVGDDETEILNFARTMGGTAFHHTGTAKMGPKDDPQAVVDARLRLRGGQNLRVVDCSVIPHPVSGNTNAPAIMIGEKAADMILEDARAAS